MKSVVGCFATAIYAVAFPLATLTLAQPADLVSFNITATDLGSALNQFGRQSNRQIVFSGDATTGHHVKPLQGNYQPQEALDVLLRGSGLSYKVGPDNTIVVFSKGAAAKDAT